MNKFYFIISTAIVVFLIGLAGAFYIQSPFWASYLMVGSAIGSALLNNFKSRKNFLQNLAENPKKIGLEYIFYVGVGGFIEWIFGSLLNLWSYNPATAVNIYIPILAINYPFMFFFVKELFRAMLPKLQKVTMAFGTVFVFNAIIHEVPNLFLNTWEYEMSWMLVILGWAGLTAIPLFWEELIK